MKIVFELMSSVLQLFRRKNNAVGAIEMKRIYIKVRFSTYFLAYLYFALNDFKKQYVTTLK